MASLHLEITVAVPSLPYRMIRAPSIDTNRPTSSGHDRKDLHRRRATRDERRHTPKRSLLVGKQSKRGA